MITSIYDIDFTDSDLVTRIVINDYADYYSPMLRNVGVTENKSVKSHNKYTFYRN